MKKTKTPLPSKAPSIAAIAADLLSKHSCSIRDIADAAMKVGASPIVWGEGKTAKSSNELTNCLIAAEAILGLFAVRPILNTIEEKEAFELKKRDGCQDAFSLGPEKGEAIYDSILWVPEGSTPR